MKRIAILLGLALLWTVVLPTVAMVAVEPILPADATASAPTAGATNADSAAPVIAADGTTLFPQMVCNVISNNGQKVVIVGGMLPETAALPAKVEVAVPTGSDVFWVGEVAGNENGQAGDISLALQKRTEGNSDIYSATMTQFHTLQVEYNLPDDPFQNVTGDDWAATLTYTPLYDLEHLDLAAEVPAGAVVNNPDFTLQGPGGSGGNIYLKEMGAATGGQPVSTEITYTANATTANGQTTGENSGTVTTVLIVIIVALIAALVFVLFNRKSQSR
ncbi:MAG: hypothetical protein LBJ07_01585 [Actinomycetes bacterium]|jgi:hypothetical protein|nr:hypothetical protein [Actinomycetes bacterium]